MTKLQELHSALVGRQKDSGLLDGPYAAKLGISRPYWYQIRTGILPVTLTICVKARIAFPDLWQLSLDAELEIVAAGRKHRVAR